MSIKVMSEVWDYSNAEGHAFVLLLSLADHADEATRTSWPAIDLLAKKCRVSRSTVQRAIKELEKLGEVTVERGVGRASSRYTIERYQIDTSPIPEVSACDVRGVTGETSEVSAVTPKPSMNRQGTITSLAKPFETDFAACWALYPRKAGRADALGAYQARRRDGVSAEDLLEATRRYAEARRGEDQKFTKHGKTFFGPGEHWRELLDVATAPQVVCSWCGALGHTIDDCGSWGDNSSAIAVEDEAANA